MSRAMSATSGDDGGAFSASLSQAMDLIARCRYAEMMGVRQGDEEARNTLIHTIFENSRDHQGNYPMRRSLSEMIEEHEVATFNREMDIKRVYEDLKLETDDQKLVMLFIAVVNACREQMYANHDVFFRGGRPERFHRNVQEMFDGVGLEVGVITGELVKDDMFQYLRSAKKLNQLRNSLLYGIFDARTRDSGQFGSWLSGLGN